MSLTLTGLPGIPLVQPGDDLSAIVLAALARAGLQLRKLRLRLGDGCIGLGKARLEEGIVKGKQALAGIDRIALSNVEDRDAAAPFT